MNRRTFSAALVAGAADSLTSTRGMAATASPTKSRNVVLVHGLFAAESIAPHSGQGDVNPAWAVSHEHNHD